MKTLALIPARGGSKGIPRKNIRLLEGRPLIGWTIEAALASNYIDSVVVSTDDDEIARISRDLGAQVPFMRPKELAQDNTPGMDPVLHALDQLPQFDHIMLLQPTSPLRTTDDIDGCIELALRHKANAVVSICEPAHSPFWMVQLGKDNRISKFIEKTNAVRRQELPLVYSLNGALYFASTTWLKKTKTFISDETIGYVMPQEKSIDIDTPLDWKMAELLLSERMELA